MKTINLTLKTINVPYKPPIEVDFIYKVGKPIFDCCDDDCAKFFGFTSRDDYRRTMNTKKGYKRLLKTDKYGFAQ